MSTPLQLQPKVIAAYYELYDGFKSPLDKYFNFAANPNAGDVISYDLLSYSQIRPRVNSRDGEPQASSPSTLMPITYRALTYRRKKDLSAKVLRDQRAPGQANPSSDAQIAIAVNELALEYEYFKAWIEAGALVGSLSYYTPGVDNSTVTLNIFDDTTVIDTTVATSWATSPSTAAVAATTLNAIKTDFASAATAIGTSGMNADTVIMNSTTFGYITACEIVAGVRVTEQGIFIDGRLPKVFGMNLELVDAAYIHPVTGSSTKLVGDNVAIFIDSNASRAGRYIRECEVLSLSAPENTYGFFSGAKELVTEPGGIQIFAESTIGPEVGIAKGTYVYSDVTST
mgnify:CR=1 FL=1